MQFNVLVSVAIALGSTLLTSVSGAALSGFANTCESISFVGPTTLQAECLNESGNTVFTSINLDSCVGNNNGGLVCSGGGNFANSCQGSSLRGSTDLVSSCRNEAGDFESTSIDLNNCLTNNNGQLGC